MDDRKVRPVEVPSPPRRSPRWRWAGLVAAAVLLFAFLVVGNDLNADRPAGAEAVVRAFAASLNDGDVDAAAGLLADDASPIILPALGAPAGVTQEPHESLAFVAGTTRLELTDCRSRYPAAAAPGRAETVVCSLLVVSDYRRDLGFDEVAGTLTATVGNGRIASMSTTVDDRFATFSGYCAWALAADPAGAAPLFDSRCRPVERATTVDGHVALAAGYAADGDPGPISVVAAFARLHNQGTDPVALFSDRFRVATFPGIPVAFPQWPFPDLDDYLRWSAAAYDIDLGRCVADPRGSGLVAVDCPEARLAGPLPEALGVDPPLTPIRFFVRRGQIVGVSGRSPATLLEAFAARCDDEAVEPFLAAACTPRYDEASARGLVAALQRHR